MLELKQSDVDKAIDQWQPRLMARIICYYQ